MKKGLNHRTQKMYKNLRYWISFMVVLVILTTTHLFLNNWFGEKRITSPSTSPSRPTKVELARPFQLNVTDVTYTIKTTENLHSRLDVLLTTWISQVPNQTYIITDAVDMELSPRLEDGHLIVADGCEKNHQGRGLSCKLGREFDAYMRKPRKWWCHFDDDNYVNVLRLVEFLSNFDPRKPWYVGRESLKSGIDVGFNGDSFRTHFAHGGCGFCVSRPMSLLIEPYMTQYMIADDESQFPNDDVMVGVFITHILGQPITTSKLFNSHHHGSSLVGLKTPKIISEQISLSYNSETKIHVTFNHEHAFSEEVDPTRFMSIHCFNFPQTFYCRKWRS